MILIVVLPIFGLILYQAKVARDLRLAEAQESAWEIAENVALREARFIDSARQLLTLLADTPDVMKGDAAQCGNFLKRFVDHNNLYADLGVADANGAVKCRAETGELGDSVERSSNFQRALAVRGFAIGDFTVRETLNRKSLSFAFPVFSADESTRAVMFAALDIRWINQLATESQLPAGVVLSIVDSNGILLARSPESEKWVGKHIPDAPLFEMLRLRAQVSRELTGLDGVERIYALKSLATNPMAGQIYVMVGIPKILAFDQVNRALMRNLMWLALVTVMAGTLAWLIGSKFVVGYVNVRVHAEEERSRLAAIVESSEEAIIGMTLDGLITSWNDGAETTYGFSAAETVGQSIFRLIPTSHHDEVSELLEVVKQGRGINRYESKRTRKGGQVFDVSASLSPIRDVHRNIVGAATITRDITSLRKSEEQMLAYTGQVEALNLVSQEIAETLSVEQVIERGLNRLISTSAFDFAFLYFSEQVEGRKFYGVAHESCARGESEIDWMKLGSEFSRHVWLCENSQYIDDLDDDAGFAATKGEIQSLAVLPLWLKSPLRAAITLMKRETHSFGADERHFLQAMSRQIALALENARLYGATVQANDDLRREIDERTRAEQALADFTAMVAHDLRSPLSNMVSITDSIRDGLFGPVNEQQRKWLWKVQESCKSLIGHISDFLDISKIDAGKLELIKAPTDLKALLQDGFLEHSIEADKKRIVFRTEISDDLPPLTVDVRRISQVLENLLSNAFKFTQSSGEILIGARRWGDAEVVWWVKDSGVGIPFDEFDRIFDTYRQLSAGEKSSHSGTGLGLAICKKVVEAHGGRIWVESEPEKGSTFFVSLPVPCEDATGTRSYATGA